MSFPISRRQLLSMIPLYAVARRVPAQQPQPAPTFTTGVSVVNVYATVRDKDGHIVAGLNKEDFTLQEDGRSQCIRYFAKETDLPLTLGLLVDTSRSQRNVIGQERSASYTFLDHVLRPDKDQAFVLHFDHEVELLQDLTGSREKLNKSLRELDVNQDDGRQSQPAGEHGQGGRRRGGTLLYDAVYLASGDDLMRKQKGRKAVIILSDGVDRGSKVSIGEAIAAAQRSDTQVYSIYFGSSEGFGRGLGGPGMGRRGGWGGMGRGGSRYPQQERPDGRKILRRMSKETGGSFFEISHKDTADKIYDRILEDLRNQYSIGYVSDQPATEARYRTISLSVDKKNLTVQAREGYYPEVPPAHS